ncbi:MAG: hypothetical protein CK604_14725 [Curvibacter sp. PD_MW3]|nr:MAG: hypothetical protein CK604_14725 [Curvibacter sp. PD_MW3]
MNDPIKTLGDDAATLVHTVAQTAAQTADQTIRSSQRAAKDGLEAVREGVHQLREKSLHVKDATATYIQDAPVKSVLVAAAVGAALMGLVALVSRHGGAGR